MKLNKRSLIYILKRNNQESTQGVVKGVNVKEMPIDLPSSMISHSDLMADSSDASETDEDKLQTLSSDNKQDNIVISCPVSHEGKTLLSAVLSLGVDDLFTLIFTYNNFNMNLMEAMKYTDVNVSDWEHNPITGLKTRVSHLVVPVHQPVGPKTCQVTETQVLQACSKPGELYVIEVEAVNAGVPYCDSFYITTHYCLLRVSQNETMFTVNSQIKYRKSVWGLVKSFIEKNVWTGLDDFYKHLRKSLDEECNKNKVAMGVEYTKTETKYKASLVTSEPQSQHELATVCPVVTSTVANRSDLVLWTILGLLLILLILTTILYRKLSVLESFDEDSTLSSTLDNHVLSEEHSHQEWLLILQKQAVQHNKNVQQWKTKLKTVINLLRQAEESITILQDNINSLVSDQVVESSKPLSLQMDDNESRNRHFDL